MRGLMVAPVRPMWRTLPSVPEICYAKILYLFNTPLAQRATLKLVLFIAHGVYPTPAVIWSVGSVGRWGGAG